MAADGGKEISGRKGGGDSARTPVEAPDSLTSFAHAHVLDAMGEGEFAGWYSDNMLKDVFLDQTPVMNADGSLNFTDITVDSRLGTQEQSYMKGFPSVENETGIGIELRSVTPWVRALNNPQLSAVRVRLSVASLSKTNVSNGDISGHLINYAIDISTDGGAYVEVLANAFNGKTTNKYERSHRIDLPAATTGWNLRVRRLTPDTEDTYTQDTTAVESITEIIDVKLRYPNTALVGIKLNAAQFRSIPSRSYRMLGRIIKIPSNYNPVTRAYTGVWDGTFAIGWTNNPAWIFYDVVTATRFGTGEHVNASMIDKWALYQIARWCDELVPDGKGGTEPRFTCTLHIQRQEQAYKVIQDLASVFNGICYWGTGAIIPVADQPKDPTFTYTNANVKDGRFSYQGSGRRARHTVALVAWNDPDDFGKQKVEYVEDPEGIARYGVQQAQVTAVGCMSQGQAQRVGRWMLLTERYETDTVTFVVGLDGGTISLPGQIIRVVDERRIGRRIGGRIQSMNLAMTAVTLDAMPSPAPAVGNELIVVMPAGVTETRIVSAVDVANKVVTVSLPFSARAVPHAIWCIESAELRAQQFRVLSLAEGDDFTAVITCLQHEPGKFASIDNGTKIEARVTTALIPLVQAPPTALNIEANERAGHVIAGTVVTGRWTAAPGAVSYDVQWQRDNGEWSPIQRVNGTEAEVFNAFPGTYMLKVSARNGRNIVSIPAVSSRFLVADQTLEPGFVATINTDIAAALSSAQNAQATADGAIEFFWQAAAPVIGAGAGQAKVGDFWVDTDTMQLWRATGGVWVDAQDDAIGQALLNAQTANTAAATAQTAANNAQASADAATLKLTDIASDSLLTPGEKPFAVKERDAITAEQAGIDAQATAAGVTTEKTAYDNAVSALTTYLATLTTPFFWTNATGNTTIVGATFKQKFLDVYAARQTLLNKITGNVKGVADSKVKTWFQSATPTAAALGDLWFNTTTKKLTRWNGANWTADVVFDQTAIDLSISDALTAANNAQATADGKIESFWQITAPVIGAAAGQAKVGDIWFDTNDGNRIWRVVGTAWVDAQDDDLALALAAASTAQGTADGKVQTYFAATAPTASAVGDLWFNTTTAKLLRWSGTNWNSEIADVTLDQLSGSGVNILPDHVSLFPADMPMPGVVGGTASRDATFHFGKGALVLTASAADCYSPLGGYEIQVQPGKAYLVSFWVSCNQASKNGAVYLQTNSGAISSPSVFTTHATANTTFRACVRVDMAGNVDSLMRLRVDNDGGAGCVMTFDGFMVEQQVGRGLTPSAYSRGPQTSIISKNLADSLAAASAAQDTADGKVDFFFQDAMPAGTLGDYWIDTNDNNKLYRHNGTTYVLAADQRIAQAITDAATAQGTADGKVTTFYATTAPASPGLGDLWYNKNTGELSRWSGTAWDTAGVSGAVANGANLIPNASFQSTSVIALTSAQTVVGTHVVDGWKVWNITGAGSYVLWNVGKMRCFVGQPSVAAGAYAAAQAGSLVPFNVEPGETYTIAFDDTHAYNGALNAGVTASSRVTLQWLDVAGAQTGSSISLTRARGAAVPAPLDAIAPALARSARILVDVFVVNGGAATQLVGTGSVALYTDFHWVSVIRKLSLDTNIGNGTTYGRTANTDLVTGGRLGLRVAGSGHRLGDQRNVPQSLATAYGSTRTVTALAATNAGAVSVQAHTVRYGGTSIAYSAVASAVTGLTVGTTYVIYCFDDAYAGGVRTWYAGANPAAVMALGDGVVVAGQITIPASGTSSGGGSGGGTNPNDWCVEYDTLLPDGRYVRDLRLGDEVECIDVTTGGRGYYPLLGMGFGEEDCFRLVTPELATLVQSRSTPMDLPDGRTLRTPEMFGRPVYVLVDGALTLSHVCDLQYLGVRRVVKPDFGNRMFFAGEATRATIATHNATSKP